MTGSSARRPLLALLAPAALFVLALTVLPLGYAVFTSLQSFRFGQPLTFIGLQNYLSLLQDSNFAAATSDQRFNMVCELLTRPVTDESKPREPTTGRLRARGQTRYWAPNDGPRVAKITANEQAFILAIDRRIAPDFGDYILEELEGLYKTYTKGRAG